MKTVHILHANYYTPNDAAFVFPLQFHRDRLLELGVRVFFFTKIRNALFDCSTLLVSSKFFSRYWERGEVHIIEFLERAQRRIGNVIWCDISDSTGTTHFKVLPYVSKYLKGQVLKDRRAYQRTYYGSRIYTDFYHRHFGIVDADPGAGHLNHYPEDEEVGKIKVGWNSGLENYSVNGPQWSRVRQVIPIPPFYPRKWYHPAGDRCLPISCRIGTDYPRATVAFQRQETRKRLRNVLPAEKISRRKYFHEMAHSVAVISPFGLGEITLRDFEAVLCGAACLKPDLGHMETWPNLWIENETYLPWKWDFSDFDRLISSLEDRKPELVQMATNAQSIYRRLLDSEDGHQEFCQRLISLISD